MLKLFRYSPILLLLALQSCSWTEYFILKNTTNETIEVVYELDLAKTNFQLFMVKPECYGLRKNEQLNWDIKMEIEDLDTAMNIVKVKLEPNAALLFGRLSNQTYVNKDQEFFNDRQFNFKFMEITQKDNFTRITNATFDDFFKKEKGMIQHIVK